MRSKVSNANEKQSIQKIESFDKKRKVAFRLFDASVERDRGGQGDVILLENLKRELGNLSDELMDLEMLLVCFVCGMF